MSKSVAAAQQKRRPAPARREPFHWMFLPVLLLLLLIPLALRLWVVEVDADTMRLFGSAEQVTTIFTQSKGILLWIGSGVMALLAVILGRRLFSRPDPVTWIYLIAGGVFLLFSLLSAALSQYPSIAFFGVYNRAEGFFTILCYIIVFLYSMYTYRELQDLRYIIAAIGVVLVVNVAMGIFQYIGVEPITTKLGIALIVPSRYSVDNVSLLFEAGKMHGTFFHYNYVGSYCAVVVPLTTVLALHAPKLWEKLTAGGIALLGLVFLLGSTSRGGLIGIAAALMGGVVIFGRSLVHRWKPTAIAAGILAAAVVGLNLISGGSVFERLPSLLQDMAVVFSDTREQDYLDEVEVRNIENRADGSICLTTQTDQLTVSVDPAGTASVPVLVFRDRAGDPVEYRYREDTNRYITEDTRFSSLFFSPYRESADSGARFSRLTLGIGGQEQFWFEISKEGALHLLSKSGRELIDLEFPEVALFAGKEQLGSMRGYIWGRAIPLLKNCLLTGYGPDTFAFIFPQKDLIGTYYAYGTAGMVVDKPHNLYLQIGLGSGLIALLAFLTMAGTYVADSLRLYAWRRRFSPVQAAGAAVFLGIVGYLGAGLFNDSVLDVAPTFWIFLGVGAAMNLLEKRRRREHPEEDAAQPLPEAAGTEPAKRKRTRSEQS